MGQPVTFFRKRDEDPGKTYDFTLQGTSKVLRVLVYARRTLKAGLLQSRNAKDFDGEIEKVRGELVKGGGLVVRMEDEGAASRLRVAPVMTDGYIPPSRALLVGAGSIALSVDLQPDQPIEVPLGGHLILPVDETAQVQLETLAQHLRWFSRDLELLVLDSIARPTLDYRVEELENQVYRNVQRVGAQAKGWGGIRGWITPASAVLTVLAILLLGNGIWLQSEVRGLRKEITAKKEGKPVVPEPTPTPPVPEPDVPEPVQVELPEPGRALARQAVSLFDSLARANPETYEGALYEGHFSRLASTAINDAFRDPNFAWGLAKLAFVNSRELAQVAELKTSERRSATKRLLRDRLRKMDDAEVSALAYVACRAFGEPAFPHVKGDDFPDRVPLPRDCKELSEDEVIEGFESMRNKLRDNLTNA